MTGAIHNGATFQIHPFLHQIQEMRQYRRVTSLTANQWGKVVKEVDRFYPSSKTCSHCGFVMAKIDLTLAIRNWQCPSCDTQHDRDINASLNILNQADRVLTLS